MPTRVDVPGMGIVEFPDGMSDAQIAAAIQKSTAPPSRIGTFGNSLVKGAAGFGDMIGNGLVNTSNLLIAGYGATKGALGGKDLPDLIPSDALSGYSKIGHATGLIKPEREPTDALGRVIDVTGQVIGGGGVNPAAAARSLSRGAVLPVVRDVVAATAGGVGAGLGAEAVRNVKTGSDTLDRTIKAIVPILTGAAPSAVLSSRGTAGDRTSAALSGVTEEQLRMAKAIQEKANAAGTPVTGYEAIQAVTGINPKMQTQQRVTEQSDAAAPLTSMMQKRPENNAAYFERVAGGIAPKEALPDTLAGQLRTSAEGAINEARQSGNAAAKPYYDVARQTKLSPAQASATVFEPALNMAIEKVRKDPLNHAYGKPANSVEVIDAAKKYLDDIGSSASMSGKNSLASNAKSAALTAKNVGIAASPEYGTALQITADNMKNVVEPMKNSQVGKLSRSDEFKAQAGALLPENPMDVTPSVVDRTIRTVSQQDPDVVRKFLAQYLRGTFNESSGGGVGNNAFGGYQFAKKVADNPGQKENLIQALKSSGANPAGISDALDIFRAQGMKPPVNSATTANATEAAAMGQKKMIDAILHPVSVAPGYLAGKTDAWRNGMSTKEMAKALSDPNSIQRLEELARANGTYNPLTQQMLAQMILASRANSATQPEGR
jgi:hypothetical protein